MIKLRFVFTVLFQKCGQPFATRSLASRTCGNIVVFGSLHQRQRTFGKNVTTGP